MFRGLGAAGQLQKGFRGVSEFVDRAGLGREGDGDCSRDECVDRAKTYVTVAQGTKISLPASGDRPKAIALL